ncbi:TIGR03557 family F420-dependent LLM class oxidoreductase [Methanosarcina mazei]|uniref:F420-dependent oxidoreductase n=2 Tax=Methanosarcina mazei TaxID=2209 RepID=A0A0F8I7T9_METMZ|nr:TIGR03557 family F420-dependent LLM class oxidoreductase [Methanosarcina mazei]KKG07424.1 F420-dependent oxidoreductase [Methanosarcina mazei]KKG32547.1 F420-dependent oxidoreductase [Methanosarcina mazei]KKG36045.1 F420-dependent oxidoreductase [Methanosarcina mazei]KKG40141.1 F420-dependent oxidoreductase [Methanosarcina mazei]KKG42388.1 F420-dependent oxidoreductase [Methanosarcina mazei]
MLKIGYKIGAEQFLPSEMLEQAIVAEKNGFESIDVSDHFHPWSEEGQACFSWSWLGAAAARTETIELGPGVTCPILRYNPAIIAQAAATVSSLAGGRTYLGVGTGEALNEYPITFEWPAFRERQAMMIEAVQLIRSLWTGEKVDFQGCYYRTKQAKLYTLPKNEIPIYISSLVPKSAYLAGYYGDGLITVGGSLEIPEYERMLSEVRRGATDAGRDFEKMPKAVELFVEYTDDTEKVVESFKKYWAGAMIPALFLNKIYTPAMSAQNGKVVGRDTIQKSVCISGDPEKHIEYVKKYIDAGFTHFYFHSAAGDQIDFLERYGKDVLPALKKMG